MQPKEGGSTAANVGSPIELAPTVTACAPPTPTVPPTPTAPPSPEPTEPDTTTEPPDTTPGAPDSPLAADPVSTVVDAAGGAAVVSGSPVFLFADPDIPVGESTVVRTGDAVLATFWVGGLVPSEAITLWWVVYNQPENCSAPGCGEDDIFTGSDPAQGPNEDQIEAASIVVGYAAGTLVVDDGTAFMVARLDTGRPGVDVIIGGGELLQDAASAEIHLVARSHGPAIAGLEAVQTTSYAGDCETFLDPPVEPTALGQCADIAFTVHQS